MFTFGSNLFDATDLYEAIRYPVPRHSQGNVDASFKDGVYTALIDCAGADKSKFNVSINRANELVVSYPSTEGFRCRSFSYYFPLGKVNVVATKASYVDGVLTVTVNTQKSTDTIRKIEVN